jgi:hypothetical protein
MRANKGLEGVYQGKSRFTILRGDADGSRREVVFWRFSKIPAKEAFDAMDGF